MEIKTPVLFIVFNRPETTLKVFQRIREARPPKLYVAADGAREGHPGEKEKCGEVRTIATAVDWDCEVKTIFREENLGCKYAVSGAIDWFFENEEMGIILEDDCLPNNSFFQFCDQLLRKYENNPRVMHVNGNNFGASANNFYSSEYTYHFGHFPQVWGWASWCRAWVKFDYKVSSLGEIKDNKDYWDDLFINKKYRKKQFKRWEKVYHGKIDTWDFQWQFSVISNHGLTIVPKNNLVSNIGFGEEATHTKNKKSNKADLKAKEIEFPLTHPPFVIPDRKIDYWYQENMLGTNSIAKRVKNKIGSLVK